MLTAKTWGFYDVLFNVSFVSAAAFGALALPEPVRRRIRAALEQGNRAYEERFGHVYLVSASGRSAEELLAALREGVVTDEELRVASLTVIAAEAARLERLVGDVLDLAKLDARRFTVLQEEVDMERLVDRAYAAFGEEARRRGIDYRRTVDAKPVIVTDGDRVLQIISNLLSNAFRWTPNGGRVELELSMPNGKVSVAVGDNGAGIAPEELERIFRPFWSRDDSGTGLGLAIAHELAVALGGRIDLDSEPGRGSRFELLLDGNREQRPSETEFVAVGVN